MTLNERQIHRIIQQGLQDKKPKLVDHAERQRQEGYGWRVDGLAEWSTEAILAKLRELGADVDADRFREQAKEAQSCKNLRELWRATIPKDDSPWDDFPLWAAEELWRRLTPDLVCPERIADRLDAAMAAAAEPDPERRNSAEEDLAATMQAITWLDQFPAEERGARFEELHACTTYDYTEWMLDFVFNDLTAPPDDVARVADVMADADPGNATNYQGDLAVTLAQAGENEAALSRVAANLERFPDDVWIRIKAGDACEALGRLEDALEHFVEAMRRATRATDWHGAEERVFPILHQLDREEEYEQILCRCPRPRDSHLIGHLDSAGKLRAIDPERLPDSPALRADVKIGRNDPCPCGSGKKYKKCCLGRDSAALR